MNLNKELCVYVCVFRAEAVTLNDCLQLSYLPSKRNHMLLLYPREILILDLELSQTVGVVAIERSGVPFIQVCVCMGGCLCAECLCANCFELEKWSIYYCVRIKWYQYWIINILVLIY